MASPVLPVLPPKAELLKSGERKDNPRWGSRWPKILDTNLFLKYVEKGGEWKSISKCFKMRTATECRYRAHCTFLGWTPEQDARLVEIFEQGGSAVEVSAALEVDEHSCFLRAAYRALVTIDEETLKCCIDISASAFIWHDTLPVEEKMRLIIREENLELLEKVNQLMDDKFAELSLNSSTG